MTQQDINRTEWSNPQNWSGPKLFGLYSSKTDTRLWIPKRTPAWGWTINVGHSASKALFVGILVGIVVLLVVTGIPVSVLIGAAITAIRYAV